MELFALGDLDFCLKNSIQYATVYQLTLGFTIRLRRILAAYPCDKEILKELLQNADDAGCSNITFIKVSR